jgi:acyl carrier protein
MNSPQIASQVIAAAVPIDAEFGTTVCDLFATTLGRSREQITIESNLFGDLGADSLDLLDLVFALEGKFGVEITRGALEKAAKGDMSDDDFAPNGVISDAGLERLRALLPESAVRIQPGLLPRQIPTLFTVGTFARIVLALQAEGTR